MAYGNADDLPGGTGSATSSRDEFDFDVPAVRHSPRIQAVLDRRNARIFGATHVDGPLLSLAEPSDPQPEFRFIPALAQPMEVGLLASRLPTAVTHIGRDGRVRSTPLSDSPAEPTGSGQPDDVPMASEANFPTRTSVDDAAGGGERDRDVRRRPLRRAAARGLLRALGGPPSDPEPTVTGRAGPAAPPPGAGAVESASVRPWFSGAYAWAALATNPAYEPPPPLLDEADDPARRDAGRALRRRAELLGENPLGGAALRGFNDVGAARLLNPVVAPLRPIRIDMPELVDLRPDAQLGASAAHSLDRRADTRARDFEAPISPNLNASPARTAYQEPATRAQARAASSGLASPSGLVVGVAHRFGLQSESARMHSLPDLVPLSDDDEEEYSRVAMLHEAMLQRTRFRPCSTRGAGDLPCVLSSKFLSPGFKFVGKQCFRSEHACEHESLEDWTVRVEIVRLDWEVGRVCGVMTAHGLPYRNEPIVTYWEGEVVDNRNATFNSAHFNVAECTDLEHWGKFASFQALRGTLQGGAMVCPLLHSSRGVFMRWKEQEFLSKPSSREKDLTIAGFYYVCLDRATGDIDGFYHDPKSMPFQRLTLRPERQGLGVAFGDVMCS